MKKSTQGTQREQTISAFGSLDRSGALCANTNCFELRNFRPMPDGTLKRREGYLPLISLPARVRGVFSTERSGARESYAVAGEGVYLLTSHEDTYAYERIGTLSTAQGKVCFTVYGGEILLLDGKDIYTLSTQSVKPLTGYVPLLGENWSPEIGAIRPIKERPNLLTRRVRMHFDCAGADSYIYFEDFMPETVEAVYCDGEPAENWFVTIDRTALYVKMGNLAAPKVEILATMPESFFEGCSLLRSATGCATLGDAEDTHLVLYGGDMEAGKLYLSRPLSEHQRAAMEGYGLTVSPLYVTDEDDLLLGDGIQPITGVERHFDRTLFFTSQQTWMSDGQVNEGGKVRIVPINTVQGCTCRGGHGVVGNSPVSVFGGHVLRWTSETDARNECSADIISWPVEAMFEADFAAVREVFCDTGRREVWFYVPDEERRVFVWLDRSGCWTSFDGFAPSGLFLLGEQLGFFEQEQLYVFSPSALGDTLYTGEVRGIDAEYRSHFLDLGEASGMKRACRGSLNVTCGGQTLDLTLQGVNGREQRVHLHGGQDELVCLERRTYVGRFRYLRLGLRCSDIGPLHIHRVSLCARGRT